MRERPNAVVVLSSAIRLDQDGAAILPRKESRTHSEELTLSGSSLISQNSKPFFQRKNNRSVWDGWEKPQTVVDNKLWDNVPLEESIVEYQRADGSKNKIAVSLQTCLDLLSVHEEGVTEGLPDIVVNPSLGSPIADRGNAENTGSPFIFVVDGRDAKQSGYWKPIRKTGYPAFDFAKNEIADRRGDKAVSSFAHEFSRIKAEHDIDEGEYSTYEKTGREAAIVTTPSGLQMMDFGTMIIPSQSKEAVQSLTREALESSTDSYARISHALLGTTPKAHGLGHGRV